MNNDLKVGDWVLLDAAWHYFYKSFAPCSWVNEVELGLPFQVKKIGPTPNIIWVAFSSKPELLWSIRISRASKVDLTDSPCEFCHCFCLQTCRRSYARSNPI